MISIFEKIQIIKNILGSFYVAGKNEYLFSCPNNNCDSHLLDKKKFSVNFDKNVGKCWVCDYRIKDLFLIVKKKGSLEDKKKWKDNRHLDFSEEIVLFPEEFTENKREIININNSFVPLANKNISNYSSIPRNYLTYRGITDEDILYYKIMYCVKGEYENRIIIPSFDEEGYINYFVARSFVGSDLKYKNPAAEKKKIIFNELLIDWEEPVILCEGVFDAIKIGQNAIPLLGSSIREDTRLFSKIVESQSVVYISLDKDAREKEDKIVSLLKEYGVIVYKIEIPQKYKDIGEMSKKEFQECYKNNSYIVTERDIFTRKFMNV